MGSRAQAHQLWCRGLVAPWHVESSWTRARTHVPWIGRRILNHCTTREVLLVFLKNEFWCCWFSLLHVHFFYFQNFYMYYFLFFFILFFFYFLFFSSFSFFSTHTHCILFLQEINRLTPSIVHGWPQQKQQWLQLPNMKHTHTIYMYYYFLPSNF